MITSLESKENSKGSQMKHENVLLIGCNHYFHFVRNLQSLVEDLSPMVLGVYVR